MFARKGTSCGANWWQEPWRARNAIGVDPLNRATVMGLDGRPHGVSGLTVATGCRQGRTARPVPPMIAMRTGSDGRLVGKLQA